MLHLDARIQYCLLYLVGTGNVKCVVGSEKAKARLCPRHDATTERLSEFYLNGNLQQLRGLLAEVDMC